MTARAERLRAELYLRRSLSLTRPADRESLPGRIALSLGEADSYNSSKVHGRGVEPLRLAAAEPKASRGGSVCAEILGNAGESKTRSHEIAQVGTDVGQSSGNRTERAAVLEAAIERVTRALLTAADEVIPELVSERRAMREELEELRRSENVVPLRPTNAKRPGPRPAR
jgi:hypothetical protein